MPEVTDYQVYAGPPRRSTSTAWCASTTCAKARELGDIQVNLVDKHERERKSHEIALAVRAPLQAIAERYLGNAKIVEVPPGPPVLSPLVAEIYGLDYRGQIEVAKEVRRVLEATPDIVDVDDSVEYPSEKRIVIVDRSKASRLGIPQSVIVDALSTVLAGEDVTYLHGENTKYAVPVRLRFSEADRADLQQVLSLEVPGASGPVPLSEIVTLVEATRSHSIQHKDLLPVVYVTGDMAGELDSPLYGMFDIMGRLGELEQWLTRQPENPYRVQPEVGRRVAGHLRDLPRHGCRLRRRPDPDLPAGGRAVPQLPGAAGDHGADPADGHRRHARSRAARARSSRRPR